MRETFLKRFWNLKKADILNVLETFLKRWRNVLIKFKTFLKRFQQIMKRFWNVSETFGATRAITPNATRLISNLSHMAKIYDSIITSQLSTYLEKNKLFDLFQSGCTAGFSTQTALSYLLHDVRFGIDNELITILVLFDIKKAFELVDHFTLLSTLKDYNLYLSL